MHVVSRKKLRQFWIENKELETVLDIWYRAVKKRSGKIVQK